MAHGRPDIGHYQVCAFHGFSRVKHALDVLAVGQNIGVRLMGIGAAKT